MNKIEQFIDRIAENKSDCPCLIGQFITNDECDELISCNDCAQRISTEFKDELERCYFKKPLGKDGKPISIGETLYNNKLEQCEVIGYVLVGCIISVRALRTDNNDLIGCLPIDLTHSEPDTQEKIDADALLDIYAYWNCNRLCGDRCSAKIEGLTPNEYYKSMGCGGARNRDLLNRQRELDKQLMGGE